MVNIEFLEEIAKSCDEAIKGKNETQIKNQIEKCEQILKNDLEKQENRSLYYYIGR